MIAIGTIIFVSTSSSGSMNCTNAAGIVAPCGPGNDRCNAAHPFASYSATPAFHIQDDSCCENDPNGPCYDEKHGVFHLFFQKHLGHIAWGHVVSRDLTHWARMPVAIWNSEPYDGQAIFSGSCMNSVPGFDPPGGTGGGSGMVAIYPGVCTANSSVSCRYGTTVNLAWPANASDPLAGGAWTKAPFNPIAQVDGGVGPGGGGPPGGGGDSSAAWQTASGEWRMITRDVVNNSVWSSADFVAWMPLGPQPGFTQGACPSFFPLPASAPTAAASAADDGRKPLPPPPTHVYMYSDTTLPSPRTHQTVMVPGSYTDLGPRRLGAFTPAAPLQVVDNGTYYAAKDFWDAAKQRRVLWGWVRVNRGAQAMPREVTWHPALRQLLFAPLEEQALLRDDPPLTPAADANGVVLRAGEPWRLPGGGWSVGGAGNQTEVVATFTLPSPPRPVTFGLGLAASGTAATLDAYVAFEPPSSSSSPSWEVAVGVRPAATKLTLNLTRRMAHTDIRSVHDYAKSHHPPGTDASVCQGLCDADSACRAWVYVVRGKPAGSGDCCLKNATGCPHLGSPTCTAGVKTPEQRHDCGGGGDTAQYTASLALLPTDSKVEVRAFVDNVLAEVYFMGGRVALTVPISLPTGELGATLFSSEDGLVVSSAEAWRVHSIWVTPEDVLDMPRADSWGSTRNPFEGQISQRR